MFFNYSVYVYNFFYTRLYAGHVEISYNIDS